MVAEKEISSTGHDIHPEVINLDNVDLAVSDRARYYSGSCIGFDLQGEQVKVVLASRLFFFADLQATLSSDKTNVDQIDSFLARLLQ